MLSESSLSDALTYFRGHHQGESLAPRQILIHPVHMHYVARIRAEMDRRESYAAGRRLARHIHALRSK